MVNPAGLVSNTTGSPANWAPEAVFPEKFAADLGLDLNDIHDARGEQGKNAHVKVESDGDSSAAGNGNGNGNAAIATVRFSAYGLDMWALGVLLFELFYLKHPFYSPQLTELELYNRIAEQDPFTGSFSGTAADDCYTNTHTHTHSLPASVPTITTDSDDSDVRTVSIKSPDVETLAMLEGLLQKEPSQRWSIETLQEMPIFTKT